ncbi:MAG: FHA domain-containing protein [Beutenbergiaceae bacterium]
MSSPRPGSNPMRPERQRAKIAGVATYARPYLPEGAAAQGGRNLRPQAVLALTQAYVAPSRTSQGVAVAVLAAGSGIALWLALTQFMLANGSVVLAVAGLLLALIAAGPAVLLGRLVSGSGAALLAALQRWYAVAPEVPVAGEASLVRGPGAFRIAAGISSIVVGLGLLVVVALERSVAASVGLGLAALSLIFIGAVALAGWSRARHVLRGASPAGADASFAPLPQGPGAFPGPHGPAPVAPWAAHTAQSQPPPAPVPSAARWQPPPPGPEAAQGEDPTATWVPEPEPGEDTIAGAALAGEIFADGRTLPGRRPAPAAAAPAAAPAPRVPVPIVTFPDGRSLGAGDHVLVGRNPSPRESDLATPFVIEHPTLSKTHAAIRITESAVYVTDRASTNGTTVVDALGIHRPLTAWLEEQVGFGGAVLLGNIHVQVDQTRT